MDIIRSGTGKFPSLRVSGKLDAYWSDALSGELEACVRKGAQNIELNLSNISFISSAGLRVLLVYIKQMRAINGRLRIVEPSEKVREIFDLSGLTDLLLHEDDTSRSEEDAEPMTQTSDGTALYRRTVSGDVRHGVLEVFLPPDGNALQYPQTKFPSTRIGVGIGAFGDVGSGVERQFGEFLAAGGIAVCVPTDRQRHPDYMIEDGVFIPTVSVYSGLSAEASWSEEIRFETVEGRRGVPLSTLVGIALEGKKAAAILVIAETASLIGTTIKRSPATAGLDFSVPGLREQFSFTTEPSWQKTASVTAGVVSRHSSALLRPLNPALDYHGHMHSAVFSYRPLPAARFDSNGFIRTLFDEENLHTVLHLMYDDRHILSSVESEFVRGTLFVSALEYMPAEEGDR